MIAGVIQKERGSGAAVHNVRDGQRTAERCAVALLHVVRLLALAAIERVRLGVEHRTAEGVVRIALDTATAAHAAKSPGATESAGTASRSATARPTAASATTAKASLLAKSALSGTAFGAAIAELAPAASPAKKDGIVRLTLNPRRRNRLGRRVSRESRWQL